MMLSKTPVKKQRGLVTFESNNINLHLTDVPVTAKQGQDPDWKQLYRENKSLKQNWATGKCQIIDCKGHKDKYVRRSDVKIAEGQKIDKKTSHIFVFLQLPIDTN